MNNLSIGNLPAPLTTLQPQRQPRPLLRPAPDHHAIPRRSPAELSLACVANGYEPVVVERPFSYLELGYGHAPELAALAAAFPHASFHAADCGAPAPVAGHAGGMPNLTLLDTGFAGLAQAVADQSPFDFIVVRCAYDRIPAASRRHVVDLLARHLKPGGIVHVAYHALPGGATAHPLRRLLLEYLAHSGTQDLAAACDAVQAIAAQSSYFSSNPRVADLWATLREQPVAALDRAEPLYFSDVARSFATAKLDFAGAADPQHRPALAVPQQQLLEQTADPLLRETLRDYLHNTTYRSDLFVRGARHLHPRRRQHWMRHYGLDTMTGNVTAGAVDGME